MKKVAILGFGREGKSILKFVKAAPEFRGAEIWILDKHTSTGPIPRGAQKRLGKNYLSNLDEFDIVFRSPGIPYSLKELQSAARKGTQISSATKLFFEKAQALTPAPLIVGITGTKGKGTTCTLLYNMLRAAKRNVVLGGNIGTSPLELLPKLKNKPIVILELSSFQLQDLATSPDIAVVLDIFPDHQDSHKNLAEYYESKANIARFQKGPQRVFFFKDDLMSAKAARVGRGEKIPVDQNEFRLFAEPELAMRGGHNFKNAVMAATVARSLGVKKEVAVREAKQFRGNAHRLELVKIMGGVAFYNDSASTNPQTSAAAVNAFPQNAKILIAGGKDKNLDYAPLAKALKSSRTACVILFGENKNKIRASIKKSGVKIETAVNLAAAVRLAFRAARRSSTESGGAPAVVLFSPGAASFDMFKSYVDRGDRFKKMVKTLRAGKLK